MGNSSGHTKIIFEEPVVDNIPEVKTSTPAEALAQKQAEAASSGDAKKHEAKACCACPETKKARDQCIMEKGEKNCKALIEAHKECMRKLGYKI